MEKERGILAERLMMLRKKRGLSQYKLSEKIGFSRGLIGNYEQGTRQPDYETLKTFADFFDVSIDYLLGNESQQIKKETLSEEKAILEIKQALVKKGVVKPTETLTDKQIRVLVDFISDNADTLQKLINYEK